MPHSALELCWPGLLLIGGLTLVLRLLLGLCGARMRLNRVLTLHRDQSGSVQSLSFILTLPLFIMIMMGIVQVSQLMIARVFLEYAAVAAARSAIVWVPATIVDSDEQQNEIRDLVIDPQGGNGDGTYYRVANDSNKAFRIQMAAAQALMPICPSRNNAAGSDQSQAGFVANDAIQRAYQDLTNGSGGDTSISRRLANKLAYSLRNTTVQISIFHPTAEPDLTTYAIPNDLGEFYPNEIGWQDAITVKVIHNVALLPGPGRMLAKYYLQTGGDDPATHPIIESADTYAFPMSASATMTMQGQKPLIRYDHLSNGTPL
ncbi:MAG: pilus assembly protein [Planctomycetia bacterium]|nr:pilus assembly protein [Planctomycetia bacterium]